ncbi:unnamed protein product, partial [Phaeothamnion confervicola]
SKPFNLNAPDAMEYVRNARPDHLEKIRRIIIALDDHEHIGNPQWVQINLDAKALSYPNVYLTSEPPQRSLSFYLDDIHYQGFVTLESAGARIFPVRNP